MIQGQLKLFPLISRLSLAILLAVVVSTLPSSVKSAPPRQSSASATQSINPVTVATGEFPDIVRSPDGNLHIVYGRAGVIYYRQYDVSNGVNGPEENTGATYIDSYKAKPNVVVDSTGMIHVAGGTYSFKTGGSWQIMDANLIRDTDMALDSNDNLYVITRGDNASENSGPGYIQIVKRVKGAGSFTARTDVDQLDPGRNNHVYGDMAISPLDDTLYVVYRHGGPSVHAFRANTGAVLADGSMDVVGTWMVSEGVSADDGEGPAVAVDGNGVVYSIGGSGTVYRRALGGGSWTNEGNQVAGGIRYNTELTIDMQSNVYATGWGGKYNIRVSEIWAGAQTLPSLTGKSIGHLNAEAGGGFVYLVWEESSSPDPQEGGGDAADIVIATLDKDGAVGGSGGAIGTYVKWSKVEIDLNGPVSQGMSGTSNPFKIDVDVTFTGPGGTFVVPAFYDGDGTGGLDGSVWRVRFAPNVAGTWSFSSASLEPLLDGQTGTFEVIEPGGCSSYVPGGLPDFSCVGRLDSVGQHYLKFADGPYWLKGGEDDPEDFLATSVGAKGTDPNAGFITKEAAIDYLASKGVNSLYFMTHNIGGDGQNVWPWVGSTQGEAQANHEHFDIARLAQWEQLLAYIQSKGLVLHLVLEDDSGWTGFNRQMYYRELVARFGYLNAIYWNIGEEYNENYSSSQVKQWAQMIRDLDPYNHPITVHNQGSLSNWDPFVGDSRFDITSFQTLDSPQNSEAASWFQTVEDSVKTIPISFDETGKIDTGERSLARHIAWSVYMGGGNFEMHTSPLSDYRDFEGHFEDMTRARAFIEGLPFWEMLPTNILITSGTGYVFSKSGEAYAVYLPTGGGIGLDLSSNSNTYAGLWFNPRDGSTQSIGQVVGGGILSFTAPDGSDWVLSLSKSGGGGNVAPVANDQSVAVSVDTTADIALSYTDTDGPGPYTFTIVQQPSNGALSSVQGGQVTYTPITGFTGSDGFQWKVNDGLNDSNVAAVSILVNSTGNQPPMAQDQSVTTTIDTPVDIQLLHTDADGPGPYAITVTQLPVNGTLSGTDNDRVYTPDAGFVGSDSFRWKVNDGLNDSNEATVSITVANELVISGLLAASGKTYEVVDSGLSTGQPVYTDRAYTFTSIPAWLIGATYIKTANDDKSQADENFLTFSISQDATGYVAYDTRATSLPDWLSGWTDTGEILGTTDVSLRLYTMVFPAGTVSLGGTLAPGASGAESNYSVSMVPTIFPALPGMTSQAKDLDGDGLAEDTNGNGLYDFADIVALFQHLNSPQVQNNQAAFDFDGSGTVDMADVQTLFDELVA